MPTQRGAGDAVASSSAGTFIQTGGVDGAKGILAHAVGMAQRNGDEQWDDIDRPAPRALMATSALYAFAAGGNATANNTGTITTGGTFGFGVYAVATGNGNATATSSGTVTTSGPYLPGSVLSTILIRQNTAPRLQRSRAGGTITTNGSPYGIRGIFADVNGYGDAVATNLGTVSTQGQFANGAAARVLYGAGNATAVNQGAISTTGRYRPGDGRASRSPRSSRAPEGRARQRRHRGHGRARGAGVALPFQVDVHQRQLSIDISGLGRSAGEAIVLTIDYEAAQRRRSLRGARSGRRPRRRCARSTPPRSPPAPVTGCRATIAPTIAPSSRRI